MNESFINREIAEESNYNDNPLKTNLDTGSYFEDSIYDDTLNQDPPLHFN